MGGGWEADAGRNLKCDDAGVYIHVINTITCTVSISK